MRLLERQFQTLRDQTAGIGSPDRAAALEAVGVALALWDGFKRWLSIMPADVAAGRDVTREKLQLLRSAEACLAATKVLAADLAQRHVRVPDRGHLDDALDECRAELLTPTAVQMARRDPQKRSAEWFRDHLLERVEFRLGRPVLTPDLMAELPCPLDPEQAA